MARSSAKKPGEPKCRGTGAAVEGRDWVRIGGNKWLREAAEQKGKFIPREWRKDEEGNVIGRKTKADRQAAKEAAQREANEAARAEARAAAFGGREAANEAPAEDSGIESNAPAGESFLDEAPDQEEEA